LATDDKDFKIKNGLVVQGTTATVDGNDILTTASVLEDLGNVDTTGVEDGNALVYNTTTSQWEPGEATGGGGGGSYTISTTAPNSPSEGDVWFNSTNARSYIYYEDTDSSQWVEIAGAEGAPGTPSSLDDIPDVDTTGVQDGNALIYDAATSAWIPGEGGGKFAVSGTSPANPENGDTWFNSNTGKTYIYFEDYDSTGQWVEIASNTTGYLDIGQLNDVSIVSPTTGQALTFDGTGWINASPASTVDSLTDTEIYEPVDGQTLVYNSATDNWVNENIEIPPGTTISATAPESPEQGQLWWDSDNGNLYIYYNDGSGAQWVAANGPQVFVGTAPPAGYQGQLWLDSTEGKTYIYYDDGTSAQWISAIGGSIAGTIVDVKTVFKTSTQTGSVASQGTLAIADLNISHACKNTSNKVILIAQVSGTQGTAEYNLNAGITAGGSLIDVGDTAGTRTRVSGSNGNRGTSGLVYMNSVTIIADHLPASTSSVTYGVSLINADSGTKTLYLNRSEQDSDNQFHVRGVSSLMLMEVAG